MTYRGQSGRFRCDECRCVSRNEDGGPDLGESHWFCARCDERIQNRIAILAARAERKHQGMTLSSGAALAMYLQEYQP